MNDKIRQIKKIATSAKLCLMAHPDNEEHSEFADRINDLDSIDLLIDMALIEIREAKNIIDAVTPEIHNVKDKLPNVECGSYLVYAPQSFPKNSPWVVAEYKDDAKGFYSESGDSFMEDVTHWTELPNKPKN